MKQHNYKKKLHISTEKLVLTGIFTAIVSVICAFPIGIELFGVPATLQTFAMAFIGFLLGPLQSTSICGIYLLLGLSGIPVFNRFMSGPSVLFGLPGGFLFGFLFLCLFCGFGTGSSLTFTHRRNRFAISIISGLSGLIICHILGILQFSFLSKNSLLQSFLLISLPYLPKDILSVGLAYFAAIHIRKILNKAKLLSNIN